MTINDFARLLADRYEAPVSVDGTTLRVTLSDDAFERRYGPVSEWADEMDSGLWRHWRYLWNADITGMSHWAHQLGVGQVYVDVQPASRVREMAA